MFLLERVTQTGRGLNQALSISVASRDVNQCRCHHTKMLGKYNSVYGVIDSDQNLISSKYLSRWETLKRIETADEWVKE